MNILNHQLMSKRPIIQLTQRIGDTFQNIVKKQPLEMECTYQLDVDKQGYVLLKQGYLFDDQFMTRKLLRKTETATHYLLSTTNTQYPQFFELKIARVQDLYQQQLQVEIGYLSQLKQINKNNFQYPVNQFSIFSTRSILLPYYELTLGKLIRLSRGTGFDIQQTFNYGRQLLEAIKSLVQLKIFSYNLTPESILTSILDPETIYLSELSLATKNSYIMQFQVFPLCYVPPERILNLSKFNPDLFSLACILFEMHTGKRLFPAENRFGMVKMQLQLFGMPSDKYIESLDFVPENRNSFFELKSDAFDINDFRFEELSIDLTNTKYVPTDMVMCQFSVYDDFSKNTKDQALCSQKKLQILLQNPYYFGKTNHQLPDYEMFSVLLNGMLQWESRLNIPEIEAYPLFVID